MKTHLLLFCAAALLLTGCAATRQTSEQKATEQAAIAQAVREQVPAASFKIIATEMIPLRAPSKTLTDPYFVKVSDNYLESALPYFGRATNIPYGGGNALDFKTEPVRQRIRDHQHQLPQSRVHHLPGTAGKISGKD